QKTAPLPVLKSPAGSSPLSIIPLFNGNVLILFYLRSRFFLRNPQFQYAMFEFTLDILLSQIVAYIKASLTGSAETFFPDEMSVLRSEERRVGKECRSYSLRWPYQRQG